MNKPFFSIVLFLTFVTANALAEEAIIFSRVAEEGYWQVWAMKPDGSNQKQITRSKSDKRDPVCMDGGKKILYRTNSGQLFMVNLSTLEETERLGKYQRINNPSVCEATNELLFVRFDPREIDISDIWLSDLEGKDAKILTKDKRLKYQPVFDRSCGKIAFVKADTDGQSHHLWVMNSDGSGAEQVTVSSGLSVLPEFLADGQSLVFSSNSGGKDYEIYTVDIRTKEVTPLTENAVLDTAPAVSRELKKIAFVSRRSGSQQIWTMDLDGTSAVQLTNSAEESLDPQWCLAGDGEIKK